MKRIISVLLVLSMVVGLFPVLAMGASAEEEIEYGLNAKIYQLKAMDNVLPYSNDRYYDIVGTTSGEGARCSFDDTVRFENALPVLIKTSKEDTGRAEKGLTSLTGWHGADGYMMKWEGTMTAANKGDYTLVGRKIDNGFLAYVDQNGDGEFTSDEVFYDYASPNHWFDGANDRLVSNKGAFHMEAGETVAIQMWYYEAGGGEACSINVSTEGGANDKSFADAGLSVLVDKTVYTSALAVNHDRINALLPAGITADGQTATNHNGCQANNPGNHNYESTIDALLGQMTLLEEKVLPNYESDGFAGLGYTGFEYEDGIIDYTGYVTATKGGEYQFGTSKVDNCLMVEIQINGEWVTVYEFWAKFIWNDNSTTYSDTKVTLEEGKSYPIHVTFLEINGGQAVESKIKINGDEYSMVDSQLIFTTTEPKGEVKPATENLVTSPEWYYTTSGADNSVQYRDEAWYTDADVYSEWAKTTDPTGVWSKDIQGPTNTDDQGTKNQTLWLVTEFQVEDVEYWEGYELLMKASYDDNIRIYINGNLTWVDTGWSSGTPTFSLAEEATELLVEGTNVLAVKLVQGWGGASFGFDSLFVTTEENTNAPYNYHYEIGTADELMDFVADVNAANNGNDTGSWRVQITADIDMTGYDWTPMKKFIGRIYGNGHTISGITYTANADATNDGDGLSIGLFVNDLANNNANGRIVDLNFENCKLTVNATEGDNRDKTVICGIVAGMVDRGYIQDVAIYNCVIDGNASYAGGIAGVACWNTDDKGVHVENCGVYNSTINAKVMAAGVLCFARGGDKVTMGNATVKDTTIKAPTAALAYAGTWGWGENVSLISTTAENNTRYDVIDYVSDDQLYVQDRTNANGTKDYRVIVVASEETLAAKDSCVFSLTFTYTVDGEEATKTVTKEISKAYLEILAKDSSEWNTVYTAADGYAILGIVITGVPADATVTGSASYN